MMTTTKKTIDDFPKKQVVVAKAIFATSDGRRAKRRLAKKAKMSWRLYKEIESFLIES